MRFPRKEVKMKKKLVMILMATICLMLSACGEKGKQAVPAVKPSVSETMEISEENPETESTEESAEITEETKSEEATFDISGYQTASNSLPIVPYKDIRSNWKYFNPMLNQFSNNINATPDGFYINGVEVRNEDLANMETLCQKLEEMNKVCKVRVNTHIDWDGSDKRTGYTAQEFLEEIKREASITGNNSHSFAFDFIPPNTEKNYEKEYTDDESMQYMYPLQITGSIGEGDVIQEMGVRIYGRTDYTEDDFILIFEEHGVNVLINGHRTNDSEELMQEDFQWKIIE